MKKGFLALLNINRSKVAVLLSVTMISTTLCGCNEMEEVQQQDQSVNVETIKPKYDNISVDSLFVATVETGKALEVFPQISAKVIEKYYEVGDYVNAGDLLFVMDDKALQLEKKNADANVKSAAATLDAQKANREAAQAAANESIGSIETTEYERAKAVNEATREAETAKKNQSKYAQQAAISYNEADRADDEKDKAKNEYRKAKNFYKHLEEQRDKYVRIYKEEGEAAADEYIKNNTKYTDIDDLKAALEAAKAVMESASSEKSSQEGNYANSMSQRIEFYTNAEIEKGTLANAEEAKALAMKMFQDYEMFTKNTIIAEANAKVAEGQANVAASDSQLESAIASQELAQLQLTYTNVTAPISGVISEINIEKYGMASDQSVAYVITGTDNKKICFYVPENVLKNIEIGQAVTIEKDKKLYSAVVTKKHDTLNNGESLFKVEAAIGENGSEFIAGTKLNIKTSVDKRENVLTVPICALYYDDGKPYLFVAENGKAVRKDVETGIANETSIQIVSGIDENAEVITSWSSSLKDQTDIKIIGTAKVEKEIEKKDTAEAVESVNIGVDTKEGEKITASESNGQAMIETIDRVNIRAAADTESEKLGTVDAGTRLKKIELCSNGWTKVSYKDQEAYIKSEYTRDVE